MLRTQRLMLVGTARPGAGAKASRAAPTKNAKAEAVSWARASLAGDWASRAASRPTAAPRAMRPASSVGRSTVAIAAIPARPAAAAGTSLAPADAACRAKALPCASPKGLLAPRWTGRARQVCAPIAAATVNAAATTRCARATSDARRPDFASRSVAPPVSPAALETSVRAGAAPRRAEPRRTNA